MSLLYSKPVQMLLLFVSQAVIFVCSYEVFWRLLQIFLPSFRRDISWGGTVRYAVLVFLVISFIGVILAKLFLQTHQLLIQVLCILSFAFFLLKSWTYTPYRVLLLIGCATISYLAPHYLFTARKGKITNIVASVQS